LDLRTAIRGISPDRRSESWLSPVLKGAARIVFCISIANVQKHLGHASVKMARRYQRKRDRFKVNLTKAEGL
jgi:integrase